MFTGLIQRMGRVAASADHPAGRRLTIELAAPGQSLADEPSAPGESIAVDGVCLTVADIDGASATFDVIGETLRRSTLGRRRVGDRVNIERAMRPTDRLGGHFVQGHVDGTATLARRDEGAAGVTLWFAAEGALLDDMIAKGSIAIDGVSLTLLDVDRPGGRFGVALIPTTLAMTTLGLRRPGEAVNVETDLIGKWVRRSLAQMLGAGGGVTMDKLRQAGFA